MWISLSSTYVKISSPGLGKLFKKYDGITISGLTGELEAEGGDVYEIPELAALEGSAVIWDKGDDYIVVVGIISAARKDMIGATLYMVGKDAKTGDYVEKSNSCAMCKRVVINAGIKDIYIRDSKDKYRHVIVEKEFVENDDSLNGTKGY